MVFSSPIFLFLFLPVVLALCALPGLKLRNSLLLFFSVIFYAWGEVVFVFLMLVLGAGESFPGAVGGPGDRAGAAQMGGGGGGGAEYRHAGLLQVRQFCGRQFERPAGLAGAWAAGAFGPGAAADRDFVLHVSRAVLRD